MIIEGTWLMAILAIMALAIGALVVYIRLAVKREPSDVDALLSRLLKKGRDVPGNVKGKTSPSGKGKAPFRLELPGLNRVTGARAGKPAAKGQGARAGAENSPLSSLGEMLQGLYGPRKNKEKIAEEVRAIDRELNSVLRETQVPGSTSSPLKSATAMDSSGVKKDKKVVDQGSKGSREAPRTEVKDKLQMDLLDNLTLAGGKPTEAQVSAGGQTPGAGPSTPNTGAVPKPGVPPDMAGLGQSKQASSMASLLDGNLGSGDDLLSELEAASEKEEDIDLSIMKELKDRRITCEELESDLKGVLDRVASGTQAGDRKKQKA